MNYFIRLGEVIQNLMELFLFSFMNRDNLLELFTGIHKNLRLDTISKQFELKTSKTTEFHTLIAYIHYNMNSKSKKF